MATPTFSSATFLLLLVLIVNNFLFALVAACGDCPTPAPPKPKPCSPPPAKNYGKCPKDTLKLSACADILGLVDIQVGKVPNKSCCSLLDGLADLQAAVCLCTALKANVLGANLDVPVKLTLLLNYCGKSVPKGFQCA